MRGATLAVLWVGLSAAAAVCQAPPISGPAEIKVGTVGVLTVVNDGRTKLLVPIPAGLDVKKSKAGDEWFVTGRAGTYRFSGSAFWVDFDAKKWGVDPVEYDLRVVDPDPPPVPPGPNPPVPPGPTPAPIGIDGLAVVVLVDDMLNNLSAEQVNTLNGGDWADYLRANAAKDKTGQAAWRVYKKSQTILDTEDPALKAAFDAVKDKAAPWVVVSNPRKGGGESVALPATKADILALVKKYGG